MKNYPTPFSRVRQDSPHEKGVRKLKATLTSQGYEVFRVPACAGDLIARKDQQVLIFEVKKIATGTINLHSVIQGVGQLLYYKFMFMKDPANKKYGAPRLFLAIPFNTNAWKKQIGIGNAIDILYSRAKDFLALHNIQFMKVELTDEEYKTEGMKALEEGRDLDTEFDARKLEIIRTA